MADLTAELAPDYLARGLELSAEDFPAVTVSADPSQLRRVVTNIWDNSAKYKVRDVGRGFISLDAGGVLTLSDDGPGVPEEALPKLFDAFYRSDPARKNPAGGQRPGAGHRGQGGPADGRSHPGLPGPRRRAGHPNHVASGGNINAPYYDYRGRQGHRLH